MRRTVGVLALLALAGGACTGDGNGKAEGPQGRGPTFRLASALQPFSSCEELQSYLRTEGAKLVGPYGLAGSGESHVDVATPMGAADDGSRTLVGSAQESAPAPAAAPRAGVDYSGTNIQVEGVDEPDIVKTDGRRLVTMAGGRLRIVDLAGDRPVQRSTLAVTAQYQQAELFLTGDRVMVLHAAAPEPAPQPPEPTPGGDRPIGSSTSPAPEAGRAQVTVVDIADLAAPKVVAEVKLDGSLVTARMVDGVARLVLRSGPPRLGFSFPSFSSAPAEKKERWEAMAEASMARATEANREVVSGSTVEDWLGTYTYTDRVRPEASSSGPLSGCDEVARPKEFSGVDMVSVLTIDAEDPRPGPAATVLGAGELVYAGAENLYVTTTRWMGPLPLEEGGRERATRPGISPQRGTTDIHKFSIADKVRTEYLASGSVAGRVLNQFSMSERSGDLRVATTTDGVSDGRAQSGASESQVSVLRQDGENLVTVGSVGGLGKGERIYAVRFLGDRGYVVTFRQTDPLYVIDLSDPTRPAVRGELKIPGYSAYLHPVGDHRLIGVGQDATDEGRSLGTQISLFDVSDPASPRRLAQRVLPSAHSEAEFDHHAFLYWAKTGLVLLPVQSHGEVGILEGEPRDVVEPRSPRRQFVGAVGFTVGDSEVRELGRVRHRGDTPIRRSLVVGDRVLSLSEEGMMASDLATLADRAWLSF